MATGFAAADKTKPYVANNSVAEDRGYHDGNATATCMCGAVQLAFVSAYPFQSTYSCFLTMLLSRPRALGSSTLSCAIVWIAAN
jgi:hypothetical protein